MLNSNSRWNLRRTESQDREDLISLVILTGMIFIGKYCRCTNFQCFNHNEHNVSEISSHLNTGVGKHGKLSGRILKICNRDCFADGKKSLITLCNLHCQKAYFSKNNLCLLFPSFSPEVGNRCIRRLLIACLKKTSFWRVNLDRCCFPSYVLLEWTNQHCLPTRYSWDNFTDFSNFFLYSIVSIILFKRKHFPNACMFLPEIKTIT